MDQITGKEQKNHVILHYLINNEINANWNGLQKSLRILSHVPNSEDIIIECNEEWDIEPDGLIVLSKLLARYIEIDCKFIKRTTPNRILCRVEKVSIAKKDRVSPRYTITEEGLVNVTNLVSSKTIIEANMFNIPTLVRVNFDDYKKKLSLKSGEQVVIDVFKSGLERKFEVAKSSQKILYIADYTKLESFQTNEEGFINFEDDVDDNVEAIIKQSRDKKLKSELLIPILYTNEMDEIIPIGYFWLQTKENFISKDDFEYYKLQLLEMVERIKDANLIKSLEKFPVIDVSSTGLKLKVNDSRLIETLPKQKGILFELVFKLQTPFRFFARIAWAKKTADGDLLLGIEFSGRQRAQSEKVRFEDNLELIKQIGMSPV
ncbi:MAG: DUF1577 domain-containing protein [Leptospira sp.]|nr:DUF1577 domain-containing protein [Leptospira sp.]